MNRFKYLTLLAFAGIGAAAFAKIAFIKDFNDTYGVKKTSVIGLAKCAACHVGKTAKLNVYGLSLQEAMRGEKTKILTGSVMKKVEGVDSDKDGKTNLQEIQADTLPGDPKSK